MTRSLEITKLAMIGCGSMGGGMALLFAEHGVTVSLEDPSEKAMDKIIDSAKEQGLADRIKKFNDYKSLCDSLGSPKVFVFSLPHGSVGDTVLSGLMPHLDKGDIIIDAGNEHWQNTERRQGKCVTKGIRYIGMGVSGGYQAARAGPSMCPAGDDESLDLVMPLLRRVAAKDANGKPCVGRAGTGGAGHYVKMIHNGIEHGMMSAIAEVWQIMRLGLNMRESEIADVFENWNAEGPLRGTFLISIGADICRTTDKSGRKVVDKVEDKVVQDITGEEGTGIWSNEEAIVHHIPAPTLTIAHDFRLASADRAQRARAQETMGKAFPSQSLEVQGEQKSHVITQLRTATYVSCLLSYIQGINVIDKANRDNKWNINYADVLQIWRAGCIIQADHIAELFGPIFDKYAEKDSMNMLFEPTVANELREGSSDLRSVVAMAIQGDHIIPALGASLEYLKYQTRTDLPTQFYEAELDFFGNHMFDIKGEEDTGKPTEGKHHFEWRAAKGSHLSGYTS